MIKHTSNSCLEKDIQIIKTKHLEMINVENLINIVTYKLLSSIQGSPMWHRSQLQDLLTMVEEFGMPLFLKTLIVDEMTLTRWHEFNDVKYLIKKIHKNMSWKDCSVECATLFHFHVNMFMHQHILKDNGILGKIKEYVIHDNCNTMGLFMPISYYGVMKMVCKE